MSSDWLKLCQWFLVIGIVWAQDPASCINSRARNGTCVHIDLCPELREIAYKKVVSLQEKELLYRNSCGKLMVCCEKQPRKMLLPDLDICGLGNVGEKIRGGNITGLTQYRWLAALEVQRMNERKIICGGSLINTLYVLTAAHCVVRDKPKNISVRLGEYDLESDPDCDEYANCNEKVRIEAVSQKIVHSEYGRNRNDIALLKLANALPINFTTHILPICLPTAGLLGQQSFMNKEVWAAGWGVTDEGEPSQCKQHINLIVTNLDECKGLSARSAIEEPWHLCARTETAGAGDTCQGDSGGPLMIDLKGNWYVIGIVSFGEPCGSAMPAVYVNVFHYVGWILENIID